MDHSRNLPNFADFDEKIVSEKVEQYILSPDALNLVIEFDTDRAIAASNNSTGSIQELLKAEVWSPSELNVLCKP